MTSVHSVKILLCYLLEKLNRPVTYDQLLEITRNSEVIDYFCYSEALSDLESVGAIKKDENGLITLGEKGRLSSEIFKRDIPITFRRSILTAAYSYFSGLRRESECSSETVETKNGYMVNFSIKDVDYTLMNISFYAPDMEQAENITEKIKKNPVDFYKNIVNFMLTNPDEKEEKIEV